MYRRGAFREDLLAERAAQVVGIDARLAEIEELLTGRGNVVRCECGAPILRGSHFCPNCGRSLARGRRRGRRRLRGDRDRARTQALMASEAAERRTAIAAADTTCPRCGAARAASDRYCLDCGLQAAGRRGDGARLAARLAAAARLVSGRLGLAVAPDAARRCRRCRRCDRDHDEQTREQADRARPPRLGSRSASPPAVSTTHTVVNTATLPAAPEPGAGVRPNGRTAWPPASTAGRSCSSPTRRPAVARPRSQPLPGPPRRTSRQVGIIDSGGFASLQPGYFVVFSGIYGSKPTPTQPSRRPGRPDSAAPTAVRSRAERRGVKRAAVGMRQRSPLVAVCRTENICNSVRPRVRVVPGLACTQIFPV